MNFQDLYAKIRSIEEGVSTVDECGGMEMMPLSAPHAPEQSDSVSMNVSMNGSGKNGIRDLMDLLKNIEDQGGTTFDKDVLEPMGGDDAQVVFGAMEDEMGDMAGADASDFADSSFDNIDAEVDEAQVDGDFQTASTTPDPQYAGLEAVTDLGSNDGRGDHEVEKVNGGGNPMHEALVQQLMSHYQSIRES